MSKREWMKRNRAELDREIRIACPNVGPLNDEDRWQWVENDEGLYLWAKGDGVSL